MSTIILLTICTLIGYAIGARYRKQGVFITWAGKLLSPVVILLVVIMGSRIGANRELIASFGSIGLSAFIHVVIVLVVTTAAFYLARIILGFDRYGKFVYNRAGAEQARAKRKKTKSKLNRFTIVIIIAVAVGILLGYFVLPESFMAHTGTMLTVILCVLLFLIGIDTGKEGTVVSNFKSAGARVFVFPFVSIAAMIIGSVIASFILPLSVKDSVCVGCGLGWYSLAPAILSSYSAEISAIAFIHNVLREILAIIFIPLVADRVGYIECFGLSGATGMDVTLPIVERSTDSDVAAYSFICGAVTSTAVPFLTTFFMNI